MVIFESEADLLKAIAEHNALVRKCLAGELSFSAFQSTYNDFYCVYALDGHESDEEERNVLKQNIHV